MGGRQGLHDLLPSLLANVLIGHGGSIRTLRLENCKTTVKVMRELSRQDVPRVEERGATAMRCCCAQCPLFNSLPEAQRTWSEVCARRLETLENHLIESPASIVSLDNSHRSHRVGFWLVPHTERYAITASTTHQSRAAQTSEALASDRKRDVLAFPFLAIEFKCTGPSGSNLWVAENQCLGASASCVNIAERLSRQLASIDHEKHLGASASETSPWLSRLTIHPTTYTFWPEKQALPKPFWTFLQVTYVQDVYFGGPHVAGKRLPAEHADIVSRGWAWFEKDFMDLQICDRWDAPWEPISQELRSGLRHAIYGISHGQLSDGCSISYMHGASDKGTWDCISGPARGLLSLAGAPAAPGGGGAPWWSHQPPATDKLISRLIACGVVRGSGSPSTKSNAWNKGDRHFAAHPPAHRSAALQAVGCGMSKQGGGAKRREDDWARIPSSGKPPRWATVGPPLSGRPATKAAAVTAQTTAVRR
ncbi:hypothetical protein GGTG_04420 [Gaeumannomyces tritici R3-111a-1]|uniref:Uncharacterized protein n=1 Tax=Gaeumannomyces tritici (strain R3-111a-1) TaxID=644352 RepID=J3NT22_GAET3|nr:hypothetical protein GGTG_04420 [Gaeumannomyces tritici R3-111a-1]EJT79335.1 hypothetical protein GGTG_04420 [Gaeumannomyces tritici R3-111a-1]